MVCAPTLQALHPPAPRGPLPNHRPNLKSSRRARVLLSESYDSADAVCMSDADCKQAPAWGNEFRVTVRYFERTPKDEYRNRRTHTGNTPSTIIYAKLFNDASEQPHPRHRPRGPPKVSGYRCLARSVAESMVKAL